MLKVVVPMAASILATDFAMAQTEIVGNVESKCIIISETQESMATQTPINLPLHRPMAVYSPSFVMTYWRLITTRLSLSTQLVFFSPEFR